MQTIIAFKHLKHGTLTFSQDIDSDTSNPLSWYEKPELHWVGVKGGRYDQGHEQDTEINVVDHILIADYKDLADTDPTYSVQPNSYIVYGDPHQPSVKPATVEALDLDDGGYSCANILGIILTDGNCDVETFMDIYRQWARGDVYYVERTPNEPCPHCHHNMAEPDGIGGVFGPLEPKTALEALDMEDDGFWKQI